MGPWATGTPTAVKVSPDWLSAVTPSEVPISTDCFSCAADAVAAKYVRPRNTVVMRIRPPVRDEVRLLDTGRVSSRRQATPCRASPAAPASRTMKRLLGALLVVLLVLVAIVLERTFTFRSSTMAARDRKSTRLNSSHGYTPA